MYLSNSKNFQIILNEINLPKPAHLSSYNSGSYFQESQELTLHILLYFDEIELCNPLGSSAGIHKLGMVYFSILDQPRYLSTKLSNIFLTQLIKTKYLKEHGIQKSFSRLVNEINQLYREGIFIKNDLYEGTIKVKIFQIVGDNLG